MLRLAFLPLLHTCFGVSASSMRLFVLDILVGVVFVHRAHPHTHTHTHGEPCGFLGAGWLPENCAWVWRTGDGALLPRSCEEVYVTERDR